MTCTARLAFLVAICNVSKRESLREMANKLVRVQSPTGVTVDNGQMDAPSGKLN